jgi:uncharacterized membrane protein
MLELFARFGDIAATSIEGAAVLIVTAGSLDAFVRVLGVARPAAPHGARKAVWRRYGMWLLLALEFTLAADIIRTVVSPTWQEIGELAAIAVIRTFLNYFLERDLEEAADAVGAASGPSGVDARELHAMV